MTKQRRPRRSFTREFKLEAVRLVTEKGLSQAQVARDLDLDVKMLRRWRREFEAEGDHAFPGQGRLRPDEEQLRQLQRDVERLRMERDILKKALGIFSQGPHR